MPTSHRGFCFAVALTIAPLSVLAQPASFTPLGYLPGAARESYAWSISADGLTVVGESSSERAGLQTEAYKWKSATGMLALGGLDLSNLLSVANDTSATGSVTVGFSRYAPISTLYQAFRDLDGELTMPDAMGDLPEGALLSSALGVSGDGNFVVGFGNLPDAMQVSRQVPFHYDSSIPIFRPLGLAPDANTGAATGVSADGSRATGYTSQGVTTSAMRWVINPDGHITTTVLPTGIPGGFAEGLGISADGLVCVGDAETANGFEACKWIDGVLTPLGDLSGGEFSSAALGASSDGSVIVGFASSETSGFMGEAVFWDQTGIHSVKDTLQSLGVGLQGWQLQVATDVSADGRTIVGNGINPAGMPEAWVAFIGTPALCVADFNGDGLVFPDDLSEYITCFFLQIQFPGFCPRGDFNGDGLVFPDDLSEFITVFFLFPC